MRRIIGSTVTDLDQVQDKLLEHHKKQVETYTEKITTSIAIISDK
jgi:hypothetical protein